MNKTVLITGAAKGLGKAIASEFASHNYDVIVTYYSSKKEAEDLCESLKKEYSISAICKYLDVRDESCIRDVFNSLQSLDCLINNASYNNDLNIFEHTKEEFIKVLDTNLVGPFLMCKYAYDLLNNKKGSIVNIASTNGIDTMYPSSVDYDASKAGLINLTKNLSSAFAPNVRVNAVAPGWIITDNTHDMNPNFKKDELAKIAFKRFATPEEIAKLVYFVGSDDASYMTGSILRIDGGRKYEN